MKIHEDCRPCLLRQMELTARAAGADDALVLEVARMAQKKLLEIWHADLSPPEISSPLYHAAGRMCAAADPFLAKKVRYTREALTFLPTVQSLVTNANDPFDMAVRVSIAGNVIDFGTGEGMGEFDLAEILDEFLVKDMLRDDTRSLRDLAENAGTVLFIGDNAGETVFDRPFLSILQAEKLIYATRGAPIINDATLSDAVLAGVGLHAELVSSGACIPGTVLHECSREFRSLFHEADLVIAKGQGNFETLTELPREGRIFMLFIVKCSVAARLVGGKIGDMVVMRW